MSYVERMRRVAAKRAEWQREDQEARVLNERDLRQVEHRIDEVQAMLDKLIEQRSELERALCMAPEQAPQNDEPQGRLRHGQLRDLCMQVVKDGGADGLTSFEVKEEIERLHPGLRTSSVPAVLSRQAENGLFHRDGIGRYRLAGGITS